MSRTYAFIPIQLDALYLEKPIHCAPARVDFSRLPYFNGEQDINNQTPFLGEEIQSIPFHHRKHGLEKGVHLHWALPAFLTKGMKINSAEYPRFPSVPDFWLITRTKYRNEEGEKKQWVLESRYLHSPGKGDPQNSTAYRYEDANDKNAPPFRYLGRATPFDKDWKQEETDHHYLETQLTAIGYGEPTFAAFYPNCRGVFGFYDPLLETVTSDGETKDIFSPLSDGEKVQYNIVGCYQNRDDDFLKNFLEGGSQDEKKNSNIEDQVQQVQRVKKKLGLELFFNEQEQEPESKAYQNLEEALKKDPEQNGKPPFFTALYGEVICSEPSTAEPVEVSSLAVGNTGGEALSAWLGHELAGQTGDATKIEEFLESLQFASQLEHLDADTVAKFKELRHAKGFKPLPGGGRWAIRAIQDTSQKAHAPTTPEQVSLPPTLAKDLHQLNQNQLAFDRLSWQIESRKKQIYATWTKYMVSKYPPDVWEDEYPNVDELRFFLEYHDLAAIEDLMKALGEQKKAVDDLHAQLKTDLFQVQGIRKEDITDWPAFYKNYEKFFPKPKRRIEHHWTEEEKSALIQKLNTLLEVGGVFFHRPKEKFVGNRPAYNHPLLVEDFKDWKAFINGLKGYNKFINVPWEEKDKEQFIEKLNKIFERANIVIQVFPTNLDGKKEKYIQPLELDELKGSWPELLQAAKDFYAALKAGVENPSTPPTIDEVVIQLNKLLDDEQEGTLSLLPPNPNHKELRQLGEKDILHPGEHLRYNRLILEQMFPSLKRRPAYELQRKGNTRFYQPTDPVVLLAGKGLEPSPRHEQDGLLRCALLQLEGDDLSTIHDALTEELPKLKDTIWAKFIGQDQANRPQYHPLLLDWQVEYYPAETSTEGDLQKNGYPAGYLQDNYLLNPEEAELTQSQSSHAEGGHSYAGATILSPHASRQLEETLVKFIREQLREQFTNQDVIQTSPIRFETLEAEAFSKEFRDHFKGFYDWLKQQSGFVILKNDDIETNSISGVLHLFLAMKAYEKLSDPDCHYLSQSIGGFHQALLQYKQGYRLNIDDPLGFPAYQAFTQKMSQTVGHLSHAMALPHNAFFPIRAGAMNIVDLHLIDTFGREMFRLRDQKDFEATAADTLLPPSGTHFHLSLPPRFVQSARLDFRWLSATDDELEMNDHPASSPICGWMLLNELDNSLLVYDQEGKALGYIDQEQQWRVSPGLAGPVSPAGIDNPHLQQLVKWIIGQSSASWDGLFERLNNALDNIETDHSTHHQGIALLMSQPLALVRAKVQLELRGEPAQHQGWEHLRQQLQQYIQFGTVSNQTLGFENVRTPFRLGEEGKLNDGLVAFWVEEESGSSYLQDRFYTPTEVQSDLSLAAAGSHNITNSGLTLSMLMDPTGAVHLTTGVLPVATLQIPHEQYAEAISSIEVTFLTAPLLTHQELINASLPKEAGYAWSWLEKEPEGWRELSTVGHLKFEELEKVFGNQSSSIWQTLQDNGYLELDKTTGEALVTVGKAKEKLSGIKTLADLAPKLELFLNSHQIRPFQTSAAFSGPQEIREGWLKLRPVKAKSGQTNE